MSLPEVEWRSRALYAIYPSRHQLPLKTRHFIDFLVAYPHRPKGL